MKIIQVIDYKTFGDRCGDIAESAAPYADIIWFRIKDIGVIRHEAESLRRRLPDSFLVLSLEAELASELGYQGVQLGSGADISAVREKFPELTIGYSAHSINEIKDISADYYTLSPVFHTEKDYSVTPLGALDVRRLDRKIYALGGISTENVHELKGLGYEGVAGISFHRELARLRKLI